MKYTYIFPSILIALDLLSAIAYGFSKDLRQVIYWLAAATLSALSPIDNVLRLDEGCLPPRWFESTSVRHWVGGIGSVEARMHVPSRRISHPITGGTRCQQED